MEAVFGAVRPTERLSIYTFGAYYIYKVVCIETFANAAELQKYIESETKRIGKEMIWKYNGTFVKAVPGNEVTVVFDRAKVSNKVAHCVRADRLILYRAVWFSANLDKTLWDRIIVHECAHLVTQGHGAMWLAVCRAYGYPNMERRTKMPNKPVWIQRRVVRWECHCPVEGCTSKAIGYNGRKPKKTYRCRAHQKSLTEWARVYPTRA